MSKTCLFRVASFASSFHSFFEGHEGTSAPRWRGRVMSSRKRAPFLSDKQMIKAFSTSTAADGRAFAEADVDGNQILDFDEFLALQPAEVRDRFSVSTIRSWFDMADTDKSGTLSINEFFAWSLSNAAAVHGAAAMQRVFERYDADGSGRLDAIEFGKACGDLGFGAVAHQIFGSLDKDGSGDVKYAELTDTLKSGFSSTNAETKVMLTSFVCSVSKAKDNAQVAVDNDEVWGASAGRGIDTTTWRIYAKHYAGVQTELQALLRKSGGYVADLMRFFDEDERNIKGGPLRLLIDEGEFARCMRYKLGFRGPSSVISEIFEDLDSDGSGEIGFDELFEFIKGRRHSLDPRGNPKFILKLRMPDGAKGPADVAWDVDVLRTLLIDMLNRERVTPVDLIVRMGGRYGLRKADWQARTHHSFLAITPFLAGAYSSLLFWHHSFFGRRVFIIRFLTPMTSCGRTRWRRSRRPPSRR